jgi:hypothetical protein
MSCSIKNKHLRKNHFQKLKQNTSTKIEDGKYSCNNHIYANEFNIRKKKFIKLISIYIIEKIPADSVRQNCLSASICC